MTLILGSHLLTAALVLIFNAAVLNMFIKISHVSETVAFFFFSLHPSSALLCKNCLQLKIVCFSLEIIHCNHTY